MHEQQLRPMVYVQISGGVGYVSSWGDVELVELDWDNARDGDYTRKDLDALIERLRPYPHQHLSIKEIEEFIAKHRSEGEGLDG